MKLVTNPDERERVTVQRCLSSQEGLLEKHARLLSLYGLSSFSYELSRLPKTLNNQYITRGRKRGQRYDLHPEIKALRDETRAILASKPYWRPTGVMAALIVFYSPKWVTKEDLVRRVDVDNKIKAVLDAFQNVTGIGDERVWVVTAAKRLAKEDKTLVVLYDLGDIVEEV